MLIRNIKPFLGALKLVRVDLAEGLFHRSALRKERYFCPFAFSITEAVRGTRKRFGEDVT